MEFKKPPKEECECSDFGNGLNDEDFASFCKTPEALKRIVTGRIQEVGQEAMYVDGAGFRRNRKDWIARYGYDPEPAWERMRRQNIILLGGK